MTTATPAAERAAIVHPTDYSRDSAIAFAHALKIALRLHGTLSLLHLQTADALEPKVSGFHRVLETLVAWNVLPPGATVEAFERSLHLKVASFSLPARNAREGILEYLDDHPCDLAVLASRKRNGLEHWLDPSVAEKAVRRARTMILFLREGARGFVDPRNGMMSLNTVLVPLDGRIDPTAAIHRIERAVERLSAQTKIVYLHVGHEPLKLKEPRPVRHESGPVVETILDIAQRVSADVIAMPTAGRSGLLDALRGSVTAKILDDSRWPVLSVPASAA